MLRSCLSECVLTAMQLYSWSSDYWIFFLSDFLDNSFTAGCTVWWMITRQKGREQLTRLWCWQVRAAPAKPMKTVTIQWIVAVGQTQMKVWGRKRKQYFRWSPTRSRMDGPRAEDVLSLLHDRLAIVNGGRDKRGGLWNLPFVWYDLYMGTLHCLWWWVIVCFTHRSITFISNIGPEGKSP